MYIKIIRYSVFCNLYAKSFYDFFVISSPDFIEYTFTLAPSPILALRILKYISILSFIKL